MPGLESNLRTCFEQDYPEFEILFAVRGADDPAVAIVEKLRTEYPNVPTRLLITGEPPYPNAKVFSLDRMLAAAANDLVVMSDSDIRIDRQLAADRRGRISGSRRLASPLVPIGRWRVRVSGRGWRQPA